MPKFLEQRCHSRVSGWLSLCSWRPSGPLSTERSQIMNEVLECVVFTLQDDVNRDEFVAAADATIVWARKQPGFVSRELLETPGGRWIDNVRWESMAAAQAASEAIGDAEEALPFMSKINGGSVQMMHALPVVRS